MTSAEVQRVSPVGGTLAGAAIIAGVATTILAEIYGTTEPLAGSPRVIGPGAFYVGFATAALWVVVFVIVQPVARTIAGGANPGVQAAILRLAIFALGLFDIYYCVWVGIESQDLEEMVLPIQLLSAVTVLFAGHALWRYFRTAPAA